MLIKFKSRATADLIMLPHNGRQLLEIIGKSPDEPHGIVTVAQIPAAIQALEAAVAADEAALRQAGTAVPDEGESTDEDPQPAVRLRQRAAPFIDMLRRSQAEDCDVIW
ncbi:DUF1840 domain-containing protein [Diaphorobacter sp.]|uniref:DUF1840 domain-containing protein n=1 Tax=Diaphorobacter sp. TaxID=1934310 RepID=UPI003D133A2E